VTTRTSTAIDRAVRQNVHRTRTGMTRPAVTICIALGAGAQYALADDAAGSEQPTLLDEIVVTAQKRQENPQDVPISVNVFTAQQLSRQNLNSLEDISAIDPSVKIKGTSGRTGGLAIRGIGSGGSTSFDQSVSTFIDDIYHGRAHEASAQFLDVDQVEILKGPQSMFFGNNAIAGAINITTKQPGNDWDGSFRGLYGMFGQYEGEGAVNMPVNDQLQVRFAAMAGGEDGWARNVVTDQKYPHTDNAAGRISIRFEPTDELDATLKAEGSKYRNEGGLFLSVVGCPPPAPFVAAGFCKNGTDAITGLNNNLVNENPGQEIDLSANEDVLTVHYRGLGSDTLTSVTGFYSYHYLLNLDAAGTPTNQANASQPQRYEQFSQEFRLASPTGERIEYLAGLYFQSDELFDDVDQSLFLETPSLLSATNIKKYAALAPYLPLGQDLYYKQIEHVYSAFASATWNVTDDFKLSTGLRDSYVYKGYDWKLTYGTAGAPYGDIIPFPAALQTLASGIGLGTAGALSGNGSDHALMPSFRAQYELTPTAMAYFTYSRGFLAGGFNGDDTSAKASNLPYASEYVHDYELGFKSEWLERRILTNVDIFRANYTNLQVSTNLPNAAGGYTTTVRNAAAILSEGVEADLQWVIDRHFRLAADVSYVEAYYLSYPDAGPDTFQAFEGQKVSNDTGRPTPFDPKWSGILTGIYTVTLPRQYVLSVEVQSIASSNYYLNVLNQQAGAYVRLDSRITLGRGPWNIDVIGKNLADRTILVQPNAAQTTAAGTVLSEKEAPRNVVLQVRYSW
jgi:outer membrane receptor protein involved in Fe transport